MLTTATKNYPVFDLSEIITEPNIQYKNYQPLQSVKAGNFVPDFRLQQEYGRWQQFYNGAETHGPVSLRQLLSKPLVISFYSHLWNDNGLDVLKQLNALQYDINANGGNLLIISTEKENDFEKKAWEHSLSLNFYYDNDNELAKHFRIFSDADPVWNRFSGIDKNAPLLATYVVDPSKQIVYDHVNWDLLGVFPSTDILSSVYESALMANSRKSA